MMERRHGFVHGGYLRPGEAASPADHFLLGEPEHRCSRRKIDDYFDASSPDNLDLTYSYSAANGQVSGTVRPRH